MRLTLRPRQFGIFSGMRVVRREGSVLLRGLFPSARLRQWSTFMLRLLHHRSEACSRILGRVFLRRMGVGSDELVDIDPSGLWLFPRTLSSIRIVPVVALMRFIKTALPASFCGFGLGRFHRTRYPKVPAPECFKGNCRSSVSVFKKCMNRPCGENVY